MLEWMKPLQDKTKDGNQNKLLINDSSPDQNWWLSSVTSKGSLITAAWLQKLQSKNEWVSH